MAHLSRIFVWFEAFSGLNINLEKSSVMPMGSVEDLENLALELGCTTPTTYLGPTIGYVLQFNLCLGWCTGEIQEKISLMKETHISKGGRLTLIRSTLSNLPIYIMSLFRLPKE